MTTEEKEKLTELIESDNGNNWWQLDLFLKNTLPNLSKCLEVLEYPPEYINNYNCFVYGLGLQNDTYFLGGNNPIQQEFVKYLLQNGLLKTKSIPEYEDLVFYEDKDLNITHVAVYQDDDFVISKWMWGPIIKNKITDFPNSFGDKIFYCEKVDSQFIKKEYEKYKSIGIEIKPIS